MEQTNKTKRVLTPEQKKRVKLRRRTETKLALRRFFVFLMACLVGIYIFAGFKALNYASKLLKGKPELQIRDFIGEESSRIYDSSGHLLTEIGTYYRENIRYKDCPESLVDAFLSIEDSRYFEHNGFDIPRFTMAAVETLARHNTQGGSTFTMQLVKNTYFTIDAGDESVSYDASYEYKAQQIWLAMELEQYLNKKEIFELYVNKLNFGARVRGLEKAAQYYFNKHAREMNLSESALLAGIVNLPNQYNPYAYLEDATNRRNGVLRLMLNHGYITEKEYKLARSIRVEDLLVGEQNMKVETTSYPAYIDVVIQEAQELTGYDPVLKGMDIYTALVPEIQERIEYLLTDESGIPYTNDRLQVSILSMNHHDGTIVGVGGGRNYTGGARLLNRATQQFVQPGSSLKPIISYALGFEYLGFSADEILEDRPITYPGETRVLENATNNYVGDIYIKDAISMSLNIPAILTLQKVTNKIGVNAVVDYLNNLGLTRVNVDNYHLSVAIGGNDFVVTPKQNAGAHAAIMNLGVYNEPHTITRLVMSDGSVFYPKNQNRRVLSSGSSYLITQFMKNNVDVNFFNFSNELKHSFPVYAKTGTTDWGSDGLQYGIPQGAAKEKWIVASSSMLTTAIWMGYDYAEAGQPSYLDNYTINLNIPGRIHNSLLDLQEEIYTPEQLAGVQQPADVQDITYVRGTLPHVIPENWMPQSALVTSQVSQTGIENNPMVTADEYTNGEDTLNYFTVGTAGGTLSLNWGSNVSGGCSGGVKDISLSDSKNNIKKTGACLADTSWLFTRGGNRYSADIYINGVKVTTITSATPSYTGVLAGYNGELRACGFINTSKGATETRCTNGGYYSYAEYEAKIRAQEEEKKKAEEEKKKAEEEKKKQEEEQKKQEAANEEKKKKDD